MRIRWRTNWDDYAARACASLSRRSIHASTEARVQVSGLRVSGAGNFGVHVCRFSSDRGDSRRMAATSSAVMMMGSVSLRLLLFSM